MEPTQKYDAIISAINIRKVYCEVTKKSLLGAPKELNYAAMIISVFVRYVERITTIKNLVKRLNDDIAFKLNCVFLVSDSVPSKASYSRLVTKLDVPLAVLRAKIHQDPKRSVKKDSEGKSVFWYGYKGHLAVGTSSQYILQALFLSGNLKL